MRYEYPEQMVSLFSTQPKLFVISTSKLLQNSGTRLPQLPAVFTRMLVKGISR